MAKRVKLELKPRLMLGDTIAMGPGKADLLDLIEETASISAAARRMSMSYRRAWMLVQTMNSAFKKAGALALPLRRQRKVTRLPRRELSSGAQP